MYNLWPSHCIIWLILKAVASQQTYDIERKLRGDMTTNLKCNTVNTTVYSVNGISKCIGNMNDIGLFFNKTLPQNNSETVYSSNGNITFVTKLSERYVIGTTNDLCKIPRVVALYYNDNGWRGDLKSTKEHVNISVTSQDQVVIQFNRYFTGLLIKIDVQCNESSARVYVFKFKGKISYPIDTKIFKKILDRQLVDDVLNTYKREDDGNIGMIISGVCFALLLVSVVISIICMKYWKDIVKSAASKFVKVKSNESNNGLRNKGYDQESASSCESSTSDEAEANTDNKLNLNEVSVKAEFPKKSSRRRSDHTLDVFLNNIESTAISDHKLSVTENERRHSKSAHLKRKPKDSSNDHILSDFLKTFEFTEMSNPRDTP